jgi:hypothetical protein
MMLARYVVHPQAQAHTQHRHDPHHPPSLTPCYSTRTASYAQGPRAQAHELEELTQIYVGRGLDYDLARKVAEQLTAKDVIRVRRSAYRHV